MTINKKNCYLGCIFLSSAFLFSQCSPQKSVNNEPGASNSYETPKEQINLKISPAFEGINVPLEKFYVNAADSELIRIKKTGTEISVPANAFVDDMGKHVSGKIEISFREFHDAADIMASGIPMHNPETGEYMETAGMFEIRGHSNGKEIFIAPDKKIDIKLASYNEGNRFDFFKLEENGEWDTKQKGSEPEINIIRAKEIAAANSRLPQKPIKPVKFGKTDKFVFDLKTNYEKFPELRIFKDIIWQFAGKVNDRDNPENNPSVFNTNWSSIEIIRTDEHYKLVLKSGEEKFEMRVQPVLKGNDYENAMANFNNKIIEYNRVKEQMTKINELYENQAMLQRSYSLSGFGIYNWDYWKDNSTRSLEITVDFEPEFDYAEKLERLKFYLVNNNRKAVVSYSLLDLKNFRYPPSEKNTFYAVLPGNKIACFSSKDFKDFERSKPKNGDKVVFEMKTIDVKINSLNDISEVLSMN